MSEQKYAIFHTQGGLGKQVAATAVARTIKNNHPDRELVVVSSWPEVFVNLDFVDRVYRIGMTPYFYKDYVEGKDSILFKQEPYTTTEHIHGQGRLIENWCKMHGLKYSGEMPQITFNVSQAENAMGRWRREKPVLLIQTNGGPLDSPNPYSWTRDMPKFQAAQIIEPLKEHYHIIQIGHHDANRIDGVEFVKDQMSNMDLAGLVAVSSARILIDSSLQHMAAALQKPSVVLWVGTKPEVFGYDMHKNITPIAEKKFTKLPDSYLFDVGFDGRPVENPYDTNQLFNVQAVLDALGDLNAEMVAAQQPKPQMKAVPKQGPKPKAPTRKSSANQKKKK